MKKLFISVLAIASMVACNTEEVLVQQGNPAIGFESLVDNATRATDPSLTEETLTGFNVWAFMDQPDGVVFDAEDVKKGANGYTYSNIQYWIPGHNYYFAAIAPMDSANWSLDTANANTFGAGKVTFTNVEGSEDLLYAAKTVSTENMAAGQDMEKVKFQFNHLLSKVNFTFKNGFSNGIYSFVVTNVEMKAPKAGSINLAQEDWWSANEWVLDANVEDVTLDFGDVVELAMGASATAERERLTIPADASQSYDITFTVDLYVSGVHAGKYNKTASVDGVALEMGKAYNFTTTISQDNVAENGEALKPIEFDVEGINEWVNAGADVEYETSTKVATAAELKAAIAAGDNVTLTADINLDETRAADAGLVLNSDVVIDGNGFALTTSAVRAIQIIDAKNVTVKNLTLNAGGERGIQLQGEGQTLVVDNVKAVSKNYTLNFTSSCKNANVTVNNCDLKGLNTVNVWATDSSIVINNTTLRCEDNATEGYAVVYNAGVNTNVTVNGGEVIVTGTSCDDTYAAVVTDSTASVEFNGTEGDCYVEGQNFAINYADGYRYTFSTLEAAYETAQDGETIVLLQNVKIDAPLHVSKNIVFDLNGKTISIDREGVEKQDYVFAVFEGGKLTINGEGNVAAGEANTSVAVWAYGGDVVINGGYYTNAGEGCDLIYADKGSVVEINGGTFKAVERKDGVDGTNEKYSALNCKDNSGSSFVVKGGKYYMFDPANNASENPAVNFVAEGYESVKEGDWYIVK